MRDDLKLRVKRTQNFYSERTHYLLERRDQCKESERVSECDYDYDGDDDDDDKDERERRAMNEGVCDEDDKRCKNATVHVQREARGGGVRVGW